MITAEELRKIPLTTIQEYVEKIIPLLVNNQQYGKTK